MGCVMENITKLAYIEVKDLKKDQGRGLHVVHLHVKGRTLVASGSSYTKPVRNYGANEEG